MTANQIKASLQNTFIEIKIANMISKALKISTSLKEVDDFWPLYNLRTINILAYTDDISLLGNNLETETP